MRACLAAASAMLAILLGACSHSHEHGADASLRITGQNIDQICRHAWRLADWRIGWQPAALVADSEISFRCDPGLRITGHAGINRYFGEISIDDKGTVSWPGPAFGTTMMAGPPEMMDQEQRYLETLTSTTAMTLQDGRLCITGDALGNRLEFVPVTVVEPEALLGTWLRPIRGAPSEKAALEGLRFLPEGIVHLIGIYSMNGLTWRLDGDRLTITTNTERYPQPHPLRYRIPVLDAQFLVIEGEDYLAGSYERTASSTAGPLPAGRAAAITANLDAYERVSGETEMGDAVATFDGYSYGDTLRHIDERIDQGDYGTTRNRYFLDADGLFYYRSHSELVAMPPQRPGERDRIQLILAYETDGEVRNALKVVNGKTGAPSEHELTAPKQRLDFLRYEIDALRTNSRTR